MTFHLWELLVSIQYYKILISANITKTKLKDDEKLSDAA